MVCNLYSTKARPFDGSERSSAGDDEIRVGESPAGSATNIGKHVVIVMDGLKDFTMEPLEWALHNIMPTGSTVTLLGLMPWLNIPLSSKTWRDVWMLELEDLSIAKDKSEWKSDAKYLKLQAVIDLCKKYGVLPQKEVVMGYPPRLLVVERIVSLHATWVVFDSDKYHKKNRDFYAEKIPCNMVMMNEGGDVDMIRGFRLNDDRTPGESPASLVPTPQLNLSQRLKVILEDCDEDESKKAQGN
ncbi:uncharacterized protein LOC116106531 [Pistacia vera]|uniref:uncharacterized protein LOC116106531 n=1 Tax=Pistacia vera TaxID=55513 RepID=UPI001262C37B|nr:uncharacterized protein LOC116106531 [Pistacia vera]